MSDQATGLLSPWLRTKRFAKVKPHIFGRVLDFGCGIGEFSEHCNPERYLGFDVDRASLETARRKHPEFTFTEEIRGIEKFNTIVLLAVMEHLKEPETVLKELGRKLEPKGRIILTTPCSIARFFHTFGAHLGLFSMDASKEHHKLLDYTDVSILAENSKLKITHYSKFLLGMNQLFILEKRTSGPDILHTVNEFQY